MKAFYDILKTRSTFILLALALWICLTSLLVFWAGDDSNYRFMINNEIWDSAGKINNFSDLFTSMYFHYLNVNGRYVAHFLVQLFCGMCGQTAFANVNALVWAAFIVMIVKTAGGNLGKWKLTATATLITLLTFATKMMPTCQIGYIWMMALSLLWLLLLNNLRDKHLKPHILALLFVFSIIAGNGQESLNIGIAVAIGAEALRRKLRLSSVEWVMIIGFAIGLAFLCFSPAVFRRVAGTSSRLWSESFLHLILNLRAFWILTAVVLGMIAAKKLTFRDLWNSNRFWIVVMAALLAMNIAIKVYCNRQLFGVELCALIILLRILPDGMKGRWIAYYTALALIMMGFQFHWIIDSSKQYVEMSEIYAASDTNLIYYDRHVSATSYPGLTARYNETAAANNINDITHSFSKYLKSKYHGKRFPKIIPAKLQNNSPELNSVEEYYPGHYLVVVDTVCKHRLVLHREWNIPLVHIPMTDITVDSPKNYTKGRRYATYLVVPENALARTVGVSIISD